MWPHATIELDECASARGGSPRTFLVGHGDIIGRMSGALVSIHDPRVSEAHAMISLRGGRLHLLALRRRFFVEKQLRSDIILCEGLRVELALGLGFRISALRLPQYVLGLSSASRPPVDLIEAVSFVVESRVEVVRGYVEGAVARLFPRDGGWCLTQADEHPRDVKVGSEFQLAGELFRLVNVPAHGAGTRATAAGENPAAIRLVLVNGRVDIFIQDGTHALSLSGIAARLVTALRNAGEPVAWTEIADGLWPDAEDADLLRSRWDMALYRLRSKLRATDLRVDLVRTDGAGLVELFLHPSDHVQDGDSQESPQQ